jgi:hypothetical protein
MNARMDAKRTWYMLKDALSKTTGSHKRRNNKFLLPILIKEKIFNYFCCSKDPYFH